MPLDKRLDKHLDDGFFLVLRFTGEADSSESDESSESEDGGGGAIAVFALALANFADALFFLVPPGAVLLANGEGVDSTESDDGINAPDSSELSEEGGMAPLLSLPEQSWHCAWMARAWMARAWMARPQPHPLQQQSPPSSPPPHPLQQQQRRLHPLQQQQWREVVQLWAPLQWPCPLQHQQQQREVQLCKTLPWLSAQWREVPLCKPLP